MSILTEAAEGAPTLPMSPELFGIAALVVFALSLAVTFAFKNVGQGH